MTGNFALVRSLVIYAICLPLAIWLGYLLANERGVYDITMTVVVPVCVLCVPLFLRWHYVWMIACWNLDAVLFFIPGRPAFWTFMIAVSFGISILHFTLNRKSRFISVPSVTRPLVFLLIVVLVTARLTGGISIYSLSGGGGDIGGKHYIWLLIGIFGYFAITAQHIPLEKAKLYTTLFFFGLVSFAIGSSAGLLNPDLNFIFLVFPPDAGGYMSVAQESVSGPATIARFGGLSLGALGITYLMLLRYGVEGVLDLTKVWRPLLCLALLFLSFFGGFRSMAINLLLTVAILFYLEGLLRSRFMPIVALLLVLGATLMLPFANHLPKSMQRTLTFLPIHLSQDVEDDAKGSTEWRTSMWSELVPDVPKYLLLGKGYNINTAELEQVDLVWQHPEYHGMVTPGEGAKLAGDYHNGPLSVIIPFGVFGAIGFIWFLVAGGRVLYRNYKFGDPALQRINRFLYAYYLMKVIMFFVIFGSLYSDFVGFTGLVGLSVALNGGLRRPALAPAPSRPVNQLRLEGAPRPLRGGVSG